MRILIDCDNVLNNLTEVILELYDRDWNDNLHSNDIVSYHMEKFVKGAAKDSFYHYFVNKEVWKKVKPDKEAKKVINQFREKGYEIYVCTSTEPENAYKKSQWCWREFGINPRKEFILTHNKRIIQADYLIDDCIDNFGYQRNKIILDKPWNRNTDKLFMKNSNVVRCSDWKAIGEYISEVEK